MDPRDLQRRALSELQSLASSGDVSIAGIVSDRGPLVVAIDLPTSSFIKVDGGLPVELTERLLIEISSAFPWVPPQVHVEHDRWAGRPHVLQGRRLCLYLDPSTEWNPASGIAGFLSRLWDWFADAIANRFDPSTALYHPVGGVFHRTEGSPIVVVNEPLGSLSSTFQVRQIALKRRSDDRIDVNAWHSMPRTGDDFPGILVILSDSLPYGGGKYLSDLAVAIRGQDSRNQRRQFLSTVSKVARLLGGDQYLHVIRGDQYLHVIIAVPNPHLVGEAGFHLIGCRIPSRLVSSSVDTAKQRHKPRDPHPNSEPTVEWTYVDDNRPGVSTRRDYLRPVSWYAGKTIEIWGCGALGSWIAELLTRSGARKIVLRDNGHVTRGILVRQNYTELDVGRYKVDALADRLRSISDSVTVSPVPGLAQAGILQACGADLIIDCTVNTAVAVGLDELQSSGKLLVPVVQVATDNQTATLAILTITTGDGTVNTNQLDDALRKAAASNENLSPFRGFWDLENHPVLIPTIGCSVPTFHGSGADSCAIAATAVTLAATALGRRVAGAFLFGAAHTPYDVPLRTAISLGGFVSAPEAPFRNC